MNFKQWFEKKYADKNGNYSMAAQSANYLTKEGWMACKKQILEILKDEINHTHFESEFNSNIRTIDFQVIEKIEKL